MRQVEILSPIREQEFPDEWYAASDASHFWFLWRFTVLQRALAEAGVPTHRPLAVLDIGCGSGVLAEQLESTAAWVVDGTDLNSKALERCRPRRGRTLYYDVTEERAELLGRYDVVVLFDILEHLSQPRSLVHSAMQHLKPDGILLINVPALPVLMSAYDRAAGHQRRYTRESLGAELEGLGLRARVVRYWGLSLVPLLAARKVLLARGGPKTIDRGFRPPFPGLNALLVGLMRVETRLLHSPVLGTSLMYLGSKSASLWSPGSLTD